MNPPSDSLSTDPLPKGRRCPLCDSPNDCAMASGAADASACWCRGAPFDAELRARARHSPTACICADCARPGVS